MNSSLSGGECLSCAIVSGQKQSLGGTIAETSLFHAHQDYAYPVAGMVIVASRRHFRALDEMTKPECDDFMPLVRRLRLAQREVLGLEHIYYFYNEDTSHHFHLWMMPRHEWMTPLGKSVESVRPALIHARDRMSSADQLAEVERSAQALRCHLSIDS